MAPIYNDLGTRVQNGGSCFVFVCGPKKMVNNALHLPAFRKFLDIFEKEMKPVQGNCILIDFWFSVFIDE